MSQYWETVPDAGTEGDIVYEDPSISGGDIPIDDSGSVDEGD